jgi:hypothetical protein
VAKLPHKLLVEKQTKSRPRHSNDNALAQSKNGSILRKHLGYCQIPQHFAARVNRLCVDHLNPYVNFYHSYHYAETITDFKGRQRQRYPYRLMTTPY